MKKIWFWVRLGLSAGLVAVLLLSVDFQDFLSHLTQVHPVYLLVAFLIAMADRVIMAYKWNILLAAKSIRISLMHATGIYLTSSFLGLFLPATVGGDAVRAFGVAREGYEAKDVVSSILIERLFGIIALLVFVLLSIVISIFTLGSVFFDSISQLFWIFLILFAALMILTVVSLNKAILTRGSSWIKGHFNKILEIKLVRKLREVYESYLSYEQNKAVLGAFLLLSFVENLFPIFMSYLLSLAFGMEIPLLYFFILVPIVLVLVRIPISIDGIGIQEGTYVYFFALVGLMKSDALLLGIAAHVMAVVSILPGGILYGYYGLELPKKAAEKPAVTADSISAVPGQRD